MLCCRICLSLHGISDMREEEFDHHSVYSIFNDFCGLRVPEDQVAGACVKCISFLCEYYKLKNQAIANHLQFLKFTSKNDNQLPESNLNITCNDKFEDDNSDQYEEDFLNYSEEWIEEYIDETEAAINETYETLNDCSNLEESIDQEIDQELPQNQTEVPEVIPEDDLKTSDKFIIKNWDKACPYCFLEFDNARQLSKHKQSHITANGGFECDLCGKKYLLRQKLVRHLQFVHLVDRSIRYECKICDKTYSQIGQLSIHIKAVHLNERLICHICSKQFKKTSSLTNHIKVVHDGVKKLSCPECDKKFATAYAVDSHVTLVHRKTKPFECKICGKKFGSLSIKIVHEGSHQEKTLKCPKCDFHTNTNHNLKRHMIRHQNTYNHECQLCQKLFKSKTALNLHKLHHQDGQIPCQYCPKKFKYMQTMRMHVDSVHLKKKVECPTCKSLFATKCSLSVHQKVQHLGIRIECECGRFFDRKERYRKHGEKCEFARCDELI